MEKILFLAKELDDKSDEIIKDFRSVEYLGAADNNNILELKLPQNFDEEL